MIADDLSHDSRDVHVYVWAQMRLLNIYLLAHLWASLIGHTPDRCSIIQVQPEKKSPTPPLLDRYPSAIHYRTRLEPRGRVVYAQSSRYSKRTPSHSPRMSRRPSNTAPSSGPHRLRRVRVLQTSSFAIARAGGHR